MKTPDGKWMGSVWAGLELRVNMQLQQVDLEGALSYVLQGLSGVFTFRFRRRVAAEQPNVAVLAPYLNETLNSPERGPASRIHVYN